MSLKWLHAWVYGLCSLCQVCRGSCSSIRFSRLLSNLVVRVAVSAKKKKRLHLFFGRINWLLVAWLLKDSSLKKCVLVMVTHFPLKCVMVVELIMRFVLMEKIIVEVVVVIYTLCLAVPRFISYDHVVFKRKFAIVFVFYHFTKEIKPTPTSSRQATSALRWVFHRKTNYLTQRFATNRTQLTKTTVKTRIQEPMFLS